MNFSAGRHCLPTLWKNCCKKRTDQCTVIQRNDITFEMLQTAPIYVQIVLRNSNSYKIYDPFHFHFQGSGNIDKCRVKTLYKYVQTFGHRSGPLFRFSGAKPVTYAFVAKNLQNIIRFIGLNPALYKGQHFKIGTDTHSAQLIYFENCI